MARIESVNIGKERPLNISAGRSGIFKEPASVAVKGTKRGLEGDCVYDTADHGGPDQAVYIYFSEDYDFWAEKLGRALAPGTFGDNLTISGLTSADVAVGDRLIAGEVVLEVTAPRIPCGTLAARMGDPGFSLVFREAERPGVYCRVIEEGSVAAGTDVIHQAYAGERIGAVKMYREWFVRNTLSPAELRKTLAAPIAIRARADWEELLAAAEMRG